MTGFVVIVAGIAAVAGASAYTITAGEWARRLPPRRARREGLRAALVAFAVFMALGLLIVALTAR